MINDFINRAARKVRLRARARSAAAVFPVIAGSLRRRRGSPWRTIRGDVIVPNIAKEKSEIREIRVDSCASVSYVACITLVTRPKFAEGRSPTPPTRSSPCRPPSGRRRCHLSTHPLSSISFDSVPLIGSCCRCVRACVYSARQLPLLKSGRRTMAKHLVPPPLC